MQFATILKATSSQQLHTFWVSWYIFRLSECGTLETISFGIDVKNEWQRLLLETAAGPGCLHFTWL